MRPDPHIVSTIIVNQMFQASSLTDDEFSAAVDKIDYAQAEAYRAGYADAVRNYAVWNNGELFVGVMRRPLKEVLAEVATAVIPIL